MLPAEFTEPQFITYAVGALIQLGAAIWIFSLAPGDSRHRSFAVLVTLNAIWDVVEGLFFAASPPRDDYYLRVYTYLAVWSSAALVWFLSLYPVRHRRSAWIGLAALATAVALSAWLAVDNAAALTPVFSLVALGWTPLLTFGAFLTLRTPMRRPDDPRAWSMVLVASAFLVYPLSQAVTMLSPAYWPYLWGSVTALGSIAGIADGIVEVAYLGARVGALILAILAVIAASKEPTGRAKATFVAVLLGAVLLARLLDLFGIAFPAVNAVVFGVVIMYALARARLFDADLRLKLTISRGTVVATFTFVFILVSQLIEAFFQEEFGQNYIFAGVACGLLLFALSPLQRWSENVAGRLLPRVEKTTTYTDKRKRDVYREVLADVWQDGRITVKERILLDAFAKELGIPRSDAAQLEVHFVRDLPPLKAAKRV